MKGSKGYNSLHPHSKFKAWLSTELSIDSFSQVNMAKNHPLSQKEVEVWRTLQMDNDISAGQNIKTKYSNNARR